MSALVASDAAEYAVRREDPAQLNRELADMRNAYLEQYRRANEYLHQRNLLEDEIAGLKHANYLLQQTCRAQANDIGLIKDAYQSSTSWKLTAPIRAISTFFKRLFGRKNA